MWEFLREFFEEWVIHFNTHLALAAEEKGTKSMEPSLLLLGAHPKESVAADVGDSQGSEQSVSSQGSHNDEVAIMEDGDEL